MNRTKSQDILQCVLVCLSLLTGAGLLSSCETIGISRQEGGYAIVAPTVGHQMLLDTRQLTVFDLRSPEEYEGNLGHIAGAINVPISTIEHQLPELVPYQDQTVLVYGDNPEEAETGARILVAAGFRNIVLIEGGIREWIDLGYKTVVAP